MSNSGHVYALLLRPWMTGFIGYSQINILYVSVACRFSIFLLFSYDYQDCLTQLITDVAKNYYTTLIPWTNYWTNWICPSTWQLFQAKLSLNKSNITNIAASLRISFTQLRLYLTCGFPQNSCDNDVNQSVVLEQL